MPKEKPVANKQVFDNLLRAMATGEKPPEKAESEKPQPKKAKEGKAPPVKGGASKP